MRFFAEHLNALHAARKAFIQMEADERIRRALRNKVRASEQVFENGDRVFYKREGKERWLGPGTVLFQDGKLVFVCSWWCICASFPKQTTESEQLFDR